MSIDELIKNHGHYLSPDENSKLEKDFSDYLSGLPLPRIVYTHILSCVFNDDIVLVYSTTDHPDSHYGIPVWVDCNYIAYCEVGQERPFYVVEPLI